MDYTFQFRGVWIERDYLLGGVVLTLEVMVVSYVIAFVIGLLLGALRLSKRRSLNLSAGFLIEVCRNTPALVQLIWIFYCLPIFIGIDLNPIAASIIALSINLGAYMAEDFRAGIQSVERGQVEAARSLGLSYGRTMQKIIIPQALRILIPPLLNHAVAMMKWSALVSVLGVADLTYRAQLISTKIFRPIEVFTSIGIVYFLMSITLSYVVRVWEKRSAKY